MRPKGVSNWPYPRGHLKERSASHENGRRRTGTRIGDDSLGSREEASRRGVSGSFSKPRRPLSRSVSFPAARRDRAIFIRAQLFRINIGDSPFRFCSSILGDHPRLFSSEPSLERGSREGCFRFDSLALRTSVHFEDAIRILAEILLELNSPRGN